MGRMKEMYINICNANGGDLPEGITVADVARMKELEIYEWKLYERKMEKIRNEQKQKDNSAEIKKIQDAEKKFRFVHREDED